MRVVLVDDDVLVLKLGRALFEQKGFTVSTASNWIELNYALSEALPALMVVDVKMPSLRGDQLTRVLKGTLRRSQIPVVLISDFPEDQLEQLRTECGANGWLRKPLTVEKVDRMIREWLPAFSAAG